MKLRASTSGEYKHGKHDRKQNTHILSQTNAELISYYHKINNRKFFQVISDSLINTEKSL